MSRVGWNDSETMYSSGKIEIAAEDASPATSRRLAPGTDAEQAGLCLERRARRVVPVRIIATGRWPPQSFLRRSTWISTMLRPNTITAIIEAMAAA